MNTNLYQAKILVLASLVWLLMSFGFSYAAPTNPREIEVLITDIPPGTKSLFIPLKLSTDRAKFSQTKIQDTLLAGYTVTIVEGKDGRIAGISIGGAGSASLPGKMNLRLRVNLMPLADSGAKQAKYPPGVTVEWLSPWVYNRSTEIVSDSYAGVSAFKLASAQNDSSDKTPKRNDTQKNNFFIKTFGRTLIEDIPPNSAPAAIKNFGIEPSVSELTFFVVVPPVGRYNKLWVPIRIQNKRSVQFVTGEPNTKEGVTMRISEDDLLEVATTDPNGNLEAGLIAQGTLIVRQAAKSDSNSISFGSVLAEPSRPIAGVNVKIIPQTVTLDDGFQFKDLLR